MHMKYWLHGMISFARGWVTFGEYFTGKWASTTNCCWCHETKVIATSCGIKISAVHRLVLSKYTHLTDGQNCDGNTVRCITCSRTVNPKVVLVVLPDPCDREEYRRLLSTSQHETSLSSSTPAPPRHRYCDTRKLLWCVVILAALILFIGAVIHNMEPAFVSPVL